MAFLPMIGQLILAASGATFATAAAASATAAVVGTAAVASTVYGVKSMVDAKNEASRAAGAAPPPIAPPTPGTTSLSPSSQQASMGLRQQQARQRGIKSTMLAGDAYQGIGGGGVGMGKKLGS
jgi:hypothetical protein